MDNSGRSVPISTKTDLRSWASHSITSSTGPPQDTSEAPLNTLAPFRPGVPGVRRLSTIELPIVNYPEGLRPVFAYAYPQQKAPSFARDSDALLARWRNWVPPAIPNFVPNQASQPPRTGHPSEASLPSLHEVTDTRSVAANDVNIISQILRLHPAELSPSKFSPQSAPCGQARRVSVCHACRASNSRQVFPPT